MLLVTTRRIRQKQQDTPPQLIASAPADSPPDEVDVVDLVEDVPGVTIREWVGVQAALALAQGQRAKLEKSLNFEKRQHTAVLQQLTRQQRQTADIRQVLTAARQQRDTLTSRTAGTAGKLSELREMRDKLQQSLNASTSSVEQSSAELPAAESLAVDAERLVSRRHSALLALRELSVHHRDQVADIGVATTVIEFSNSAGTSRTPIVVDISDRGFEFPATQVRLRRKDMDGFTPIDNPLLSGVQAIHRQRSRDSQTTRPYVLLLVRPSGTLDFYIAQRVFKDTQIHFGYELIGEDQVVTAAPAADGETEAVQTAVLNSLTRRQNYRDAAASLRQRIAGFRGAQRDGPGRTPPGSNKHRRHPHTQDFGKPIQDTGGYGDTTKPVERFADLHETESRSARHGENPVRTSPADNEFLNSTETPDGSPHSDAAPVDVRQPVTSLATTRTRVEQELANAIAARKARQRTQASKDVTAAVPAPARSAEQRRQEQRLPLLMPDDGTWSPDNSTHNSDTDGLSHDEFWSAMQPLGTQRPDSASDPTEHAQNQTVPFPLLEGHRYRPFSGSAANVDGTGRDSPTTVPTAPMTGNGYSPFSAGVVSYEQVTIYLDSQNYTIVGEHPVSLHRQSISQIVRAVTVVLFEISHRNPHPLAEVTLPAAKFVVSPGAHALYMQLAVELHRLNIPVTSMVSMDAHIRDRSGGFISAVTSQETHLAGKTSSKKELP